VTSTRYHPLFVFNHYLSKKGLRVIRRGWPDFRCVKQQYNRILKEYTGNFFGILPMPTC
jgi:hypothetical protein